jgi:hypothetical protein
MDVHILRYAEKGLEELAPLKQQLRNTGKNAAEGKCK